MHRFHATLLAPLFAALLLGAPSSAAASGNPYVLTPLGSLPGYTFVHDVNAHGQAVGHGSTAPPAVGGGTVVVRWQDASPQVLGPESAVGLSINDHGTAVGGFYVPEGERTGYRAVVWEGDSTRRLPALAGGNSLAWGINQAGQVAGWSDSSEGASRAVVWTADTVVEMGRLDGTVASWALNLDDAGHVVGQTQFLDDRRHATVWRDGVPTDLGTLGGGRASAAQAVNASGVVVGWSEPLRIEFEPARPRHAVMWTADGIVDLSPGVTSYSEASDINAAGDAVGTLDGRAMLWRGGEAIDLNRFLPAQAVEAGWVLVYAAAITDQGHIVGGASRADSSLPQPFLLSPVPEPSTTALLLLGLLGLGAWARSRRRAGRPGSTAPQPLSAARAWTPPPAPAAGRPARAC